MKQFVDGAFEIASTIFDKVPVLNKFKGYRSTLGLVGMVVVSILQANSIGSQELLSQLNIGFIAFTGLALNAKGRE